MKLVTLFILCNTFAILFAIPFGIKKIGKLFNIGSKCESKYFDFFKSILDKAKAEHPTASNRDLVAFMANYMMDDPINPLFASTHALNGDIKNYTRHAWFNEFYGNITQFQDVIYGRYDLIACSVEKRYVLKMISRKQEPIEIENVFIRKMKDMFFSAKANSKFDRLLEIHASTLQKRYGYEFSDPEAKDCSEYPKAQAIIDKIEKMGISDLDKWSRLCMKELKATFQTPSSSVLKRRGEKLSYLFEGEESREGMQNEDIKPKMCESETKTGMVLLMWVEM